MEDDHDQTTKQPSGDHDRDHHQHRPQRVPLTRSQLRSDDLLNMAAQQEQERAFPYALETIESDDSESDATETSSSYTYALEREDYEFFQDSRFDAAGLGFLEDDEDEDETMEEYYEDDDDDELDVDELTYEELIALGEFIGVEKRGLSVNEISSCLHPIVWKTTSSVDRARNGIDRCVVCQVEFEKGEDLVGLPCGHPYHSECISKWLQIKKSCPICTTEVVIPNPNSSKNVKFVS